jgi:hypothetical protein
MSTMTGADVALLAVISQVEGDCERAVKEVDEACARNEQEPGTNTERAFLDACSHLLSHCERLCFALLQSPNHWRYRARYQKEFLYFLDSWPEYFSEPDEFPSLRELVRIWREEEPDDRTVTSGTGRRTALEQLLVELFSDHSELRRWIANSEQLKMLQPSLPSPPAALVEVVSTLVDLAERRRLIDHQFFDLLARDFERRRDDIAVVRARYC